MHIKRNNPNIAARWAPIVTLLIGATLLCSACGGGSNPVVSVPPVVSLPPVATLSLNGTAAVGAALPNARVQIKCLAGSVETSTLQDGRYSVKLPGASLPCALRVSAADGNKMHAVLLGTTLDGMANITPLTEMLVARATQMDAASYFDRFDAAQAAVNLTPSKLQIAQAEIVGLLAGTLDLSKLKDFVGTPLKAATPSTPSDDPHDKILDALKERVSAAKFSELLSLLASGRPLPDPQPFIPMLETTVASVALTFGQQISFLANINYPANALSIRQPVTWSVVEANGGSIDSLSGRYTAPARAGTFHVKVRRDDYPDVSAIIEVQVRYYAVLDYILTSSAPATAENTVVRDEKSLATLVDRLGLRQGIVPVATVDFSREMVVAVYAGLAPNGCYSLRIDDVTLQADKLVVQYQKVEPQAGMVCTQSITPLGKILRLPKSDLRVAFISKN